MSENINVGSVVRLKSGGPKMTVMEIKQDGKYPIICYWFYNGEELKHDGFVPESLRRCNDEN